MVKIQLKTKERDYLNDFVKKGNKKARALTRARILLLSDKGEDDVNIQELLAIGRSTIWRVKNNYRNRGVEYALTERERPGQPIKYDQKKKTEIIAWACTNPPQGRKKWSVRLLAEELNNQKGFETVKRESIRMILKKTIPSRG